MTPPTIAVVRKEFRELRRDPVTLGIAVLLPIVLLLVFGYAVRLDVRNIPLAVLDLDGSTESAAFVDAVVHTGDFVVRGAPVNETSLGRLLERGDVRVAIEIPRGFGRDLEAGRTPTIQTLIDGSYSATAMILRADVEAVTDAFVLAHTRGGSDKAPLQSAGPQPRVWFNPGLRSEPFVVSGLFAVILMAFPPLLTVLAVVREKEDGSVQQIYVSPLRSWEFVAGKTLAYFVVALSELATIVTLGLWWFDLPFRGSPLLLLGASVLFSVCTVGIGLLVSTLTRSQVVAVLLALIVTVMPSILFSGFLFSIPSMPVAVQWYASLFPARYFTAISRGLFLKGVGLRALGGDLGILAGYTVLVFALSAIRFRKKLA